MRGTRVVVLSSVVMVVVMVMVVTCAGAGRAMSWGRAS